MFAWTSIHQSAPDVWAAAQFQGIGLGHRARRSRLVAYARALAERPGTAIPELFAPLTTVASVLLALVRLGGHMNRHSDGMPGGITLWQGMKMLRLLVRGAELERMRNDKCVQTQPNPNGCIFPGMTNAERGNESNTLSMKFLHAAFGSEIGNLKSQIGSECSNFPDSV